MLLPTAMRLQVSAWLLLSFFWKYSCRANLDYKYLGGRAPSLTKAVSEVSSLLKQKRSICHALRAFWYKWISLLLRINPHNGAEGGKADGVSVFCLLLPGTWGSKRRHLCGEYFPVAHFCLREQPDQRPSPRCCHALRLGAAVGARGAPGAHAPKAAALTLGFETGLCLAFRPCAPAGTACIATVWEASTFHMPLSDR